MLSQFVRVEGLEYQVDLGLRLDQSTGGVTYRHIPHPVIGRAGNKWKIIIEYPGLLPDAGLRPMLSGVFMSPKLRLQSCRTNIL